VTRASCRRPAALLLPVTALAWLACGAPSPTTGGAPAEPPTGTRVLGPDGLGPVRIGMTVAALDAALGDTLRPAYMEGGTCAYVRPAAFPPGVSAMVWADTVVRIDVETAGTVTPEGAGVGDAEAKVLALYGARAVVTPHKYTGPEGHDVTVGEPADSTRLLLFETDGRTVIRFRAGRAAAVRLVEGCS
jgi:hypothetical protein